MKIQRVGQTCSENKIIPEKINLSCNLFLGLCPLSTKFPIPPGLRFAQVLFTKTEGFSLFIDSKLPHIISLIRGPLDSSHSICLQCLTNCQISIGSILQNPIFVDKVQKCKPVNAFRENCLWELPLTSKKTTSKQLKVRAWSQTSKIKTK